MNKSDAPPSYGFIPPTSAPPSYAQVRTDKFTSIVVLIKLLLCMFSGCWWR